jgi:hypothetical protein
MSAEDMELALMIFAEATGEDGVLDMAAAIADDELWARNAERIASDCEVRFANPPGVDLEVMVRDYVGIEGLRKGWRNWLEPWDSYLITIEDFIDIGDGRVLVLVTSRSRFRDSTADVAEKAASIFRVKDGVVVEIDFYLDQDQARRDAGLS